jgi:putative transposase
MSVGGYKIDNQAGIHFVTFVVVEWVDVFTRKIYKDIVLDSLRHCQSNRGLLLYAWCLMTNHMHMLLSAKNNDTSAILRDFKKFTSRQIINAIESNPAESRKGWMLPIFREQGVMNARNDNNQFWRQDNHPMECFSAAFTAQKLEYIHRNPVAEGIVARPEEYLYSSAKDYFFQKKCGLIDVAFI